MSVVMPKVARATRLERWAETAMLELMRGRDDKDVFEAQRNIARAAWTMACAMEDERTNTLRALRAVEPVDP